MTTEAEARDWLETLSREDEAEARRTAVEQIKPLHDLKRQEAEFAKVRKMFDPSASDAGKMGPLRMWLHDHPGETLIDHESGIEAYLEDAGKEWICAPIAEWPVEMWRMLASEGALIVDAAKLKTAVGAGHIGWEMVEHHVRELPRTPRLKTREVK